MERDERRRADALDRYWDAAQRGEAPSRPSDVDEVAARIVGHLAKTPASPDQTAAQLRVRQRIVAAANTTEETMHASALPRPVTGRVVRPPIAQIRPAGRLQPHLFLRLALAAALVLALTAGYARFGPDRNDGGGPANIPAGVLATEAATPAATTPAVTLLPRASHAILGVWQIDHDPSNPGIYLSWMVFQVDGKYMQTDSFPNVDLGTWRAVGERTVEVASLSQDVAFQDLFDPNKVPHEFAPRPDTSVRRMTITIDETGNAFAAVGPTVEYDADGVVTGTYEFSVTGTRMEAVPTNGSGTPTP